MRICFCIPHYFQEVLENKGNRYASQKIIKRKEKILSLTEVISNIHLLFGEIHIGANHRLRVFEPVHNECANDVDVFVITDKENHLLDDLKILVLALCIDRKPSKTIRDGPYPPPT